MLIHFNSPRYDRLELMKYWHRAFKDVYYSGSERPTQPEHLLQIQDSKGWVQCKDKVDESYPGVNVLFQYRCLLELMKQQPDYDGYLMIHFDVFWAYWEYESSNWSLDKFWKFIGVEWNECANNINDWWWPSPWGAAAYNKTIKSLPQDLSNALLAKDAFKPTCGWSDLFYVPKKHAEMFMYLAELASQNNLFLEIAIPTVMKWTALLASPSNPEAEIVTSFGKGMTHSLEECSPDALFCHRVNLDTESGELIRRFVQPKAWHWN